MAITFRSQKGAPLTHDELDQNFREFVYSSSYMGPIETPSGIKLFRSTAANATSSIYFPTAVGNNYEIQIKSGSNNISSSFLTGSSTFKFDFDNDHFTVSASANISKSVVIGGDLNVVGKVTAAEFHTTLVSSSIVYSSGSTKTGDSSDDLHHFTGAIHASVVDNVIPFYHTNQSSFPSATLFHGAVAHSHADGALYFAHGGQWVELAEQANISGSITATSASFATKFASKADKTAISGSFTLLDGEVTSLMAATSSYLLNTTDTLTGDLTVAGNIFVNGTGSFAVIQSVTGSAKIIGDSFIVLNNNTPAERYAGLSVYDSGSTASTASFFFDGDNNNWKYEYTSASSTDFAVALFGPEMSNRGDVIVPANNKILKGTGTHHVTSSIISDNGSTVTVEGNLTVTGGINAVITGSIDNAITASYSSTSSVANSITINNGLTTTSDVQFDSFGVGTAASGVTGEIRTTGDITAYYSSDERLKDNITPISDAINKLNQIGGYEFDWNSNSSHSGHDVGVIAQEIQKVLPEVVTQRDNGYFAVRYEKIVALLIQAVKEQQLQIEELKSKL